MTCRLLAAERELLYYFSHDDERFKYFTYGGMQPCGKPKDKYNSNTRRTAQCLAKNVSLSN